MERFAVEIKNLKKNYGGKNVVNGVDLQIPFGQCFGILGPNGAGKSTLLRMLYGASRPSAGDLFVLGLNARESIYEIKSRIGVIPQENGLELDFTVRENLSLFARLYGLDNKIIEERVEELIHLMRLEEYANQIAQTLSGGTQRRLAIARGMVHRPELLILDEPTTGLDPQARQFIWSYLNSIKAELGSVVITTHYMEEAENICDQVVIMDEGKILAKGSPKELITKWIGDKVVDFESAARDLPYDVEQLKKRGLDYQVIGSNIRVYLKGKAAGREIISVLQTRGVSLRQPNLNDVFLRVAGHEMREELR